MLNVDYGFSRTLAKTTLKEARERITASLQKEGFGVITEIDVQATMKKKLNADVDPYLILGACNPQFAHQALSAEPGVGLLLPCNVVVAEKNGNSEISAIKPEAMFSIVKTPGMESLVKEASLRLQRAVETA